MSRLGGWEAVGASMNLGLGLGLGLDLGPWKELGWNLEVAGSASRFPTPDRRFQCYRAVVPCR